MPSITTVGPVTYIADYAALHSVILALTQENRRQQRRSSPGPQAAETEAVRGGHDACSWIQHDSTVSRAPAAAGSVRRHHFRGNRKNLHLR